MKTSASAGTSLTRTVRMFTGVLALAAVLLAGCSSQKETVEPVLPSSGTTTTADQAADQRSRNEPLLPRPAMEMDSLSPAPDVNLADKDPLLDRVRLHLLIAQRALQKGDSVTAIDQCELASEKLDRASLIPGAEDDPAFAELTSTLVTLYQQCAGAISTSGREVSMSALKYIQDETVATDSIDLSALRFREPRPTTIPLPLNEEVEKNIVYFSTRMKGHFRKWLERSGRYFPVMRPILKEEGMPDEIIFLTMIESGVNPIARSWAKCVGLWQFLKSTGEMYGLRGDWYNDDRRHPEKSTRAAARHLRDLYNRYKDWHLALAAYNAGAGRIDRAVARAVQAGIERPTYWDVRPLLPTETQNYVPRYIAATIIGLDPEAYDFTEIAWHQPFSYEAVPVSGAYSVEDLARCAELPVEEFQLYNPHLLQANTPPDGRNFELRIPSGSRDRFLQSLALCDKSQPVQLVTHKVKRGETMTKVARRYGVSVADIKTANDMTRTRKLVPGEVLRIPKAVRADHSSMAVALDNASSAPVPNPEDADSLKRTRGRERHAIPVQSGMTLGGIAQRFGVTVSDLMAWNSMRPDDVLSAGSELIVWLKPGDMERALTARDEDPVPAPASTATQRETLPLLQARAAGGRGTLERHRVKRGETLASIASTFNVSIENLKLWNNLSSSSVRTGKVLKIYSNLPTVAGKPVYDSSAIRQEKPETGKKSSDGSHTVERGETLWNIAARYGVSVQDLKKWNRLDGEAVKAGQTLRVSGTESRDRSTQSDRPDRTKVRETTTSSTAATTSSAGTTSIVPASSSESGAATPATWVVRKGDNLWSISRQTGVSVAELTRLNGIRDGAISVGQQLLLGAPAPASNTASRADAESKHATAPVTPAGTTSPRPAAAAETAASIPTGAGTHIVKPGENLFSIARQYGMTVDGLKKLNGLAGDAIVTNQLLKVDAVKSGSPQAGSGAPAPADAAPVSGAAAASTPANVVSGSGSTAPPPPARPAETLMKDGRPVHIVRDGDTLYSIARQHGVSVEELSAWNRLDSFIRKGQELFVGPPTR